MKHGETLRTKTLEPKKNNAPILLKVIWYITDLDWWTNVNTHVWLHPMLQLWKYTKYGVDSYVAVSYGILICVELGEAV